MAKPYDKPIVIQKIDESEDWHDVFKLHARVNKASSDNEYLGAGAMQSKVNLTFAVRFFKALEAIRYDTQSYRIMYQNNPFDIKDYDDYMEEHKEVKLLAVSY